MPSIEDVINFWEETPLWVGESQFKSGSKEFFDEHANVVIQDCFAGQFDDRILPPENNRENVLDLGCGPGFWTVELYKRGCKKITAADLTQNALQLAQMRCQYNHVEAKFSQQNAECLTYPDMEFSHVNCQGVIHHTPQTEKCISEIARVLKPGGTASISVYYRNFLLKAWPVISPIGKLLSHLKGGLAGRGREQIFSCSDVNEIVRLYDGQHNPIGKAYSQTEFTQMLQPYFEIRNVFLHFFPARALPFYIPGLLHRQLDKHVGFMIYATIQKR